MHNSVRLDPMNLMQDAPNVVSEDGLRTLLAEDIRRMSCAELRPNVQVLSGPEFGPCIASRQMARRVACLFRAQQHGREEFKTINGLSSFLAGLGVSIISIPMFEGKVASHTLDDAG